MQEKVDKRFFKRVEDMFPVEIYPEVDEHICITGESENISTGGACLLIEKNKNAEVLKLNDIVKIIFNVPFSLANVIPFRTITCHGEIRRIDQFEHNANNLLAIAVKFVDKLEVNDIMES